MARYLQWNHRLMASVLHVMIRREWQNIRSNNLSLMSTLWVLRIQQINFRVSCATCHDPHTHKEELLRIPVKGNSELCLTCHIDQNLTGTPHNLLADKDIKLSDKERKELFKKGSCSACHTPHNPEYKVLWSKKPGKGKTINEKMCSSC
ncbi:MAG: hypothetical protein DSY34_01670, partial [Desulfurobacterium sp.]